MSPRLHIGALLAAVLVTSAAQARAAQAGSSYVVQPGDTLYRISRRFETSVEHLSSLNELRDPTALRVGQRLRVPGKDAGAAKAGASPKPTAAPKLAAPPPKPAPAAKEKPPTPARTAAPSEAARAALARLAAPPPRAPPPVAPPTAARAPTALAPRETTSSSTAAPAARPSAPAVAVERSPAAAPSAARGKRYALRWPVDGELAARFGKRDGRQHDGVDLAAPRGTKVRAAADGDVIFADAHGGYGNLVLVRHAGGLITVYAHNERNMVRKGQRVKAGQVIATVGSSGNASGEHLHFEVRRGVRAENPLTFLPP